MLATKLQEITVKAATKPGNNNNQALSQKVESAT